MSDWTSRLFGASKSPEEQVKRWRQEVRNQSREIDKQIREIEKEESKVKEALKMSSKRLMAHNNTGSNASRSTGNGSSSDSGSGSGSVVILARELVRSQKAKERLFIGKTQLHSITMQLQQQLSLLKVTGALQKSTPLLASLNACVRLPQLSQTMQVLSREMMKAGLVEEMIEEAMNQEELDVGDEEIDSEVAKVIEQVTIGIVSQTSKIPTSIPETSEALLLTEDKEDRQLQEMQARLQSLNQ